MKLLPSADLVTAAQMSLQGPFIGFAIGTRSEHDLLDLDTESGLVRLRPGIILPATAKLIKARPVRKGGVLAAELICFECYDELPAHWGPRAPYIMDRVTGTAGAVATVYTVPFAGRRHVAWLISNTDGADSLTWTTKGRRYYASGSYEEATLDTGAIAAGVSETRHEGGTDHEEMFDVMALELVRTAGSDATFALSAEVTGELGA